MNELQIADPERSAKKSSAKNGVFSSSALADGLETAFLARRRWRMDWKRRFWRVGAGGWTGNGVFGASALADRSETAFLTLLFGAEARVLGLAGSVKKIAFRSWVS